MSIYSFLRSSCNLSSKVKLSTCMSRFAPMSSLAVTRLNQQPLLTQQPLVSQVVKRLNSGIPAGHHDHSKLWTAERAVSAGLLAVMPLGLMYPNMLMDTLMAVSLIMHTHWGIEAITVDYVRPILFGTFIPKLALGLVYVFSIAILAGLLNLIFNGPGLANSIQTIWKL